MLKSIFDTVTLNDGSSMPGFGYGCYKSFGHDLARGLREAVECGYRYIDTAEFYDNEETVGEVLHSCHVPREQLYVVSKIWPTNFADPVASLEQSLRRLRLDFLDAYLLHWPGVSCERRLFAYDQLLREQQKGKIRVLGVSNFLMPHLDELYQIMGVRPALNQVEIQPCFSQPELREYCAQRAIRVISWGPLGRGKTIESPVVKALANARGKTPAQMILRWHIEKGLTAIPKSVHVERVRENCQVFDFSLTEAEMAVLDDLNSTAHTGRSSPNDPMTFAG